MFFINMMKFILLWWIISKVFGWLTGGKAKKRNVNTHAESSSHTSKVNDIPIHGDIEDADFEEIDGQ